MDSRGELHGTVAKIEMVRCLWVTGETSAMLLKEMRRELMELELVSDIQIVQVKEQSRVEDERVSINREKRERRERQS